MLDFSNELRPIEGANFAEHRHKVKTWLLTQQHLCLACKRPLAGADVHMHEAIISRGDVQGWPKRRRILIQTPYNCVLLCRDCNLGLSGKSPPHKESALANQIHIYGAPVLVWLRSLPFKAHPLKGYL